MTSTLTDRASTRLHQALFLVPIGQENEHQRTIDGLLPGEVVPSAATSALLPCWGVTDGNYLVKNKVRAQAGDVFALIRAQCRGQAAYVHRLAVVEKLVRDSSACAELYKVSHDYNMGRIHTPLLLPDHRLSSFKQLHAVPGGRKKISVPFTWIIKFRSVAPVIWNKQASRSITAINSCNFSCRSVTRFPSCLQPSHCISQAFLAKLGIPAHDPILSARPAVLAHQKVMLISQLIHMFAMQYSWRWLDFHVASVYPAVIDLLNDWWLDDAAHAQQIAGIAPNPL